VCHLDNHLPNQHEVHLFSQHPNQLVSHLHLIQLAYLPPFQLILPLRPFLPIQVIISFFVYTLCQNHFLFYFNLCYYFD
jgi:hypothetical protein